MDWLFAPKKLENYMLLLCRIHNQISVLWIAWVEGERGIEGRREGGHEKEGGWVRTQNCSTLVDVAFLSSLQHTVSPRLKTSPFSVSSLFTLTCLFTCSYATTSGEKQCLKTNITFCEGKRSGAECGGPGEKRRHVKGAVDRAEDAPATECWRCLSQLWDKSHITWN